MAEDMAAFCVLTRQPPEVYYQLTRLERNEFLKVVKRTRGR